MNKFVFKPLHLTKTLSHHQRTPLYKVADLYVISYYVLCKQSILVNKNKAPKL